MDQVEALAAERAKKLFGANHANIQPLSATIANLAVYLAVLKPGDKVLGIDLAVGHLRHGNPQHASGRRSGSTRRPCGRWPSARGRG